MVPVVDRIGGRISTQTKRSGVNCRGLSQYIVLEIGAVFDVCTYFPGMPVGTSAGKGRGGGYE